MSRFPWISLLTALFFPTLLEATSLHLAQEETDSRNRVRISLNSFDYDLNGQPFTGLGADFALEHAVSPNWNFGVGLGGGLQAIFSVIEISGWYSVTGSFLKTRREWKNQGVSFGAFSASRSGGLRLGIATQQYAFSTKQNTVPYSGGSFKVLYELGLQGPADVGVGAEVSRLINGQKLGQGVKFLVSLVLPFD